jgi:hypothetical protein
VWAAWAWRRLGRAKKRNDRMAWVVTELHGMTTEAATLSGVGQFCRHTCPEPRPVLTVEGLFGRGPSFGTLSEAAAQVYAPFERVAPNDLTERHAGTGRPVWRPRSAVWRSDILTIAESEYGAKGSEREAITYARRWDLGALQENGHASEAACIASWGQGVARARLASGLGL